MNAPSLPRETGGETGGDWGEITPRVFWAYKLTGDSGKPEVSPSMTGGLTRATPKRESPVSDLRRPLSAILLGTVENLESPPSSLPRAVRRTPSPPALGTSAGRLMVAGVRRRPASLLSLGKLACARSQCKSALPAINVPIY